MTIIGQFNETMTTAITPSTEVFMFASNADRLALRTADFSVELVVRFEKNGRQSELVADDLDHALALSAQWIDSGANYVEVFRVNDDGSLKPTLGATGELVNH